MTAEAHRQLPRNSLFAPLVQFDEHFPIACLQRLNACWSRQDESATPRFAAQTPALLVDGLHYEERIARDGIIATRESNTHDLFNALVWLQHTAIKRAMNARQAADIAVVGRKLRTRGQCALTHFDEGGAIVWLADDAVRKAWDAHDWPTLFATHRDAWGSRIAITVIGHALFDYAYTHAEMPVARALVVRVDRDEILARADRASIAAWPEAERRIAAAIAAGDLLTDPQELRPLPLAGVPGWHADEQSAAFFATAPCFRPLRVGRRYPAPVVLEDLTHGTTSENPPERATSGQA